MEATPELVENLMSRIEQLEDRLKKMEENEMIKYVLVDPKFYDRQDDVLAARLNALLSHLNLKITVEMKHNYNEKEHEVHAVDVISTQDIPSFNSYTMNADPETLGPC